jgi:hypothetical protein
LKTRLTFQIAELLAEVRTVLEAEDQATVKNKKGAALRDRDVNAPLQALNGRNGGVRDEQDHDVDDVPPTPKAAKLTKAEVRAAKREAKAAKSTKKSLKNQSKHVVAIKAADIEQVAINLHGDSTEDEGHPLATDKCIEDVMKRNQGYVKNIAEHKALLLKEVGRTRRAVEAERLRKARMRRQRGESVTHNNNNGASRNQHKAPDESAFLDEENDAIVNAILIRLGLPKELVAFGSESSAGTMTPMTPRRVSSGCVNGGSGSSRAHSQEMAMVLAQLRVAIADDLTKHENEQRQTCIRAGGFWRYVGRPVFERMMAIAERIDWRSGVVKKAANDHIMGADDAGGDGAAAGDGNENAADANGAADGEEEDDVGQDEEDNAVNNAMYNNAAAHADEEDDNDDDQNAPGQYEGVRDARHEGAVAQVFMRRR